jgi:hypothetical protein
VSLDRRARADYRDDQLVHGRKESPVPGFPLKRCGLSGAASMERMMGLEPTTFCMASTREQFPRVPIWLC